MKKLLFFLCLATAGCCKDKLPTPPKCYTAVAVRMVSITPDKWEVTYVWKRDTVLKIEKRLVPYGSNTCTGYSINSSLQP